MLPASSNIRWLLFFLLIKTLGAENSTSTVLSRLDQNLRPSEYHIYLAYHIVNDNETTFCGLVNIEFTTSQPTKTIELHAKQLNIEKKNIMLRHEDLYLYSILDLNTNAKTETITIEIAQDLEIKKKHILTIAFTGQIRTDLHGSYYSRYKTKDGSTESLVVTHFEPTAARKAFPCFDEPAMKANFSVYLAHDKDFTAVSNMPVVSTSNIEFMSPYWTWENMASIFSINKEVLEKQWIWDVFAKSKPMSTYLVAWVISKFGSINAQTGSKASMGFWTRKDALPQLNYATQVGKKLLDFYEDWFKIPFVLPKIDMFAIPDFGAGAMENWGLITFRETTLMYDPAQTSHDTQESVFLTIAHELAHQWFGNLVTMEWFSDLWLNEGFATYMSIVATNAAEPDWRFNDIVIAIMMGDVLHADALSSSRPISIPVADPNMIGQIFDGITYSKAAMVIRMMHLVLGDQNFKFGLNKYLTKYSYGNADKNKLWTTLAPITNGNFPPFTTLANIMDTWTLQTGYPLITVSRNYTTNTIDMSQKRFLTIATLTENAKGKWWIPLSCLREGEEISNSRPVDWLKPTEGVDFPLQLGHDAKNEQWIVFNTNMLAPIRVNYDQTNWMLLKHALNDPARINKIPVLSRAQLLDDAFALAEVSLLTYNTTLSLALYLEKETDYVPMKIGIGCLNLIDKNLQRTEDYGAMTAYVKKIILPTYNRMKKINRRNFRDVKMQILAVSTACHIGIAECEDAAVELLTQWKSRPDQNPIPKDLRKAIYCAGIKRSGPDEWEFLNKMRLESKLVSEQATLMEALSCSREIWILKRYLEWTLTDEHGIRSQDAAMVMIYVMKEPLGFEVAHDFIFKMIEPISARLVSQDAIFGVVFKRLLSQYTTQEQLDEFLKWRKENSELLAKVKLAIDQGIEGARINIRWNRKHKDNVIAIMKQLAK